MRDWNVWLCLVTGYETYGYLGLGLQQRLFATMPTGWAAAGLTFLVGSWELLGKT